MELNGRIALVTGAGHRVGRAIALALAGRGMHIAVHYNAAADGAHETVRMIEKSGGEARAFGCDLSKPNGPPELIADVIATLGKLHVLVNSAAIMERTPFGEISAEQFDRIMAINLRAPFLLAQAAGPHLCDTEGAIVNISDLAAFETWPGFIPHGLSKAGVVYITRALARVLAPKVRVNGVAPGTVLLPENWNKDAAEHLRETTPLERHGSPEDVTSTVLFLLDSDYLTGETIIVDGGRHIRR